jgi:hypothetical protein
MISCRRGIIGTAASAAGRDANVNLKVSSTAALTAAKEDSPALPCIFANLQDGFGHSIDLIDAQIRA